MKKTIYSSLALGAVLALASCASDEPLGNNQNDGSLSFTVTLPGQNTRFAEGTTVDRLYYSVFDTEGHLVLQNNEDWPAGSLTTTVTLQLVANQSYDIVFFADNSEAEGKGYSYDAETAQFSVTYGQDMVNNDIFDAFVKNEKGVVADGNAKTVTLTRPFAQLNIGTNDLTNAAVEKYGLSNFSSTLQIAKENVLSGINFLDGTTTAQAADLSFDIADFSQLPTDEFPVSGYSYIEMNYLLVAPTEGETANLINATYTINGKAGASTVNTLNLASTPVRQNYRTNIYGSLLTTQNAFTVTIDPDFEDEFNTEIVGGAIVKMDENGNVVCLTPALPKGVTAEDLQGKGGVALDAEGNPFYFDATGDAINQAMKQCSEIYFTPNSTITVRSHIMQIPQSGITVHGNGATISGQEQDFSIQNTYIEGSTVNVNINNLNGVKVWGSPTGKTTFNINLTNCTMKGNGLADGAHSLVMTRGNDNGATVNINLQGCYMENGKDGIHSIYGGTMVFNNCTFKDVVVPINIAKKSNQQTAHISVTNCTFNTCGISPTETSNSAYNYAAPVRVVDNGGPANSITLLVDNCTFTDTQSEWDVLLMDYRDGKTWFPVKYTISNCTPANPTVKATE